MSGLEVLFDSIEGEIATRSGREDHAAVLRPLKAPVVSSALALIFEIAFVLFGGGNQSSPSMSMS